VKIFVIGATGFVGAAVARRLADSGHEVSGLARTGAAAAALGARGIRPVAGDLQSRRPAVVEAARRADAVLYAAQPAPSEETATVEDLARALAGTGQTLILLSGSGVLLQRTEGAWSEDTFAEHDPFIVEPLAEFRKAAEDTVLAAAADGVRAMVIRPGLIWGPGDHGHLSMIYRSVAGTGAACYVGCGLNTYSNVHIDDVTRLFTLALTTGRAGGLYHAVAGEVPNRWIAEKVAADLGVEARSISPAEAAGVWGEFGALVMGASSRLRAVSARNELGWRPEHTDMLSMVGESRLRKLAYTTDIDREGDHNVRLHP
jgi:nucleoside-diphosphate-sugar epimerase